MVSVYLSQRKVSFKLPEDLVGCLFTTWTVCRSIYPCWIILYLALGLLSHCFTHVMFLWEGREGCWFPIRSIVHCGSHDKWSMDDEDRILSIYRQRKNRVRKEYPCSPHILSNILSDSVRFLCFSFRLIDVSHWCFLCLVEIMLSRANS